jgi:uncharacterized protein YndB with AHSA1/START domain
VSVADSAALRVEHTFDASPEQVFDAWTNPEVLRRWWSVGPGGSTPVVEVDLRPGGAYRLAMEDAEARHEVVGEYREVRRPERLVYTWAWVEGGSAGHMSTVTVHFRADGEDRTTVVLEHSGLPDEASRERHGVGWRAVLDSLQRTVFGAARQPS